MNDIVITEFMDDAAVADLRRDFRVHYDPKLADSPAEILRLAAAARALIVRNRTQVRGELLAGCRVLEVVGRLGVGLDNIDLEACTARGVQVFPATGANTISVAEYVIAAALVARRDVWRANERMLAGAWPRNELMLNEVHGARLGLIGFGGIARAVARRAAALGMSVAATDPLVPPDDPAWQELIVDRLDLASLLSSSDVVSLHVPLTQGTRNLIDAAALARMKPDAVLINTSRGGIIDEAALAAALKAGRLGKAVLDVFADEPLSAGSVFDGLANLFLTPHIAGVTVEGNQRVSAVTAANVRRALRRLP